MIEATHHRPAQRIEELYAFITLDEQGREGILTSPPMGNLVASNERHTALFVPLAQHLAEQHGARYRILRFALIEDVTDRF